MTTPAARVKVTPGDLIGTPAGSMAEQAGLTASYAVDAASARRPGRAG